MTAGKLNFKILSCACHVNMLSYACTQLAKWHVVCTDIQRPLSQYRKNGQHISVVLLGDALQEDKFITIGQVNVYPHTGIASASVGSGEIKLPAPGNGGDSSRYMMSLQSPQKNKSEDAARSV